MHPTAVTVPPITSCPSDREVSRLRLYLLRATYLLLIIGLGLTIVPLLVHHEPSARGVITSLLAGVWLLAFIGLRYPLQMLPLLIFELAWKTIWLVVFGLPQWYGGHVPPTFAEDFQAILLGVIVMPLVIPWGYVYRQYITRLIDRSTRRVTATEKVIR